MPNGDHWEIVLKGALQDHEFQMVFYYQTVQEPPTEAEEGLRLAGAFILGVIPELEDVMHDSVYLDCLILRPLDNPSLNGHNHYFTTEAKADLGGEAFPSNKAALIVREANFSGGTSRSNLFIPGIPEDRTDGDFLLPAFVSGPMDLLVQALNTQISTSSPATQFDPVNRRGRFQLIDEVPGNFNAAAGSFARTDGGNFVTDGIVDGMEVSFPGSTLNTGTYTVLSTLASTLLFTGGSGVVDEIGVTTAVKVNPTTEQFPAINNVAVRPLVYSQRSRQTKRTSFIAVTGP